MPPPFTFWRLSLDEFRIAGMIGQTVENSCFGLLCLVRPLQSSVDGERAKKLLPPTTEGDAWQRERRRMFFCARSASIWFACRYSARKFEEACSGVGLTLPGPCS